MGFPMCSEAADRRGPALCTSVSTRPGNVAPTTEPCTISLAGCFIGLLVD